MDFKALLEVAALIVLLIVAYAAFWVLVILFVGYVLYQIRTMVNFASTE